MDEKIKKDLYDLNYSDKFQIENYQEQNIDIELEDSQQGSSTITGIVLDNDGVKVDNATIKIFDSNGEPYLHTITDNDGRYTFSGLKSGSYFISCVKDGIVLTVPQNIYLQDEEVKTFDFRVSHDASLDLCSIAGHIIKNDDANESISGATVTLLDGITRETLASTVSNKDGEYVFYDVAEGSYIVVATKIGYKKSTDAIVSAQNNTIINLDIKLSLNPIENLGTVSGRISNKGVFIANAFVGLYNIDEFGKETLVSTTKTNSEGIYMFGKVAGGHYKVKAKMNK